MKAIRKTVEYEFSDGTDTVYRVRAEDRDMPLLRTGDDPRLPRQRRRRRRPGPLPSSTRDCRARGRRELRELPTEFWKRLREVAGTPIG